MTVFGKKMSKMNYFIRLVPLPRREPKTRSFVEDYPSVDTFDRQKTKFGREIYSRTKTKGSLQLFGLDNFSLELVQGVSNARFWERMRGERLRGHRRGRWVTARQVFGFVLNGGLWGVLRKSIVREVAIARRARLDHVISRGCRQRQMTQLPFHGILPPPLWITLRLLGRFGTASQLPWYFSFGRRSSVMLLLSKREVEDRMEDREGSRSSNGK